MEKLWQFMRFYVIPTIFILFLPIGIQLLFLSAQKTIRTTIFDGEVFVGNIRSWGIVAVFISWAFVSLKVQSKQTYGPKTSFGYAPRYQHNGIAYYFSSVFAFAFLCYLKPALPLEIYDNFPRILASLNITAVALCTLLYLKGKKKPQSGKQETGFPVIFEFYRGIDFHPRIFDVDVKQLTNCRIGMMAWQIASLTFAFVSFSVDGWNWAIFVSTLLQSVYILKFFCWEIGYFNTLDMTLDRAGFYICWGCIEFLPSLYAFASYYIVAYPPKFMNTVFSSVLLVLGLCSIVLTYLIDLEKMIFNESNGTRCLGDKKPKFVLCKIDGGKTERRLLASGFWGICRHLNYACELSCYYSWSLVCCDETLWPLLNAVFLTILIVHRTFRDEDKCRKKYGKKWDEYCKLVPYRMIPFVF